MPLSPRASVPALLCVGICILAILASLARYIWVHRSSGFYLRDFEKLSRSAEALSAETAQVHNDVRQDYEENVIDSETKLLNFELIAEADEWDTTIRIALAAWGDMIHPYVSKGSSDVENGHGDELQLKLGRTHRKYVIGIMRTKCMEATERRRALSPQMQAMQLCAMSRATHQVDEKPARSASPQEEQTTIFSAFYVPEFDFQAKLDALGPHPSTEHGTTERNVLQRDPSYSPSPAPRLPGSFLKVPSSTLASPEKAKMRERVDDLYLSD